MRRIAILVGAVALAGGAAQAADPATIDWSKVPSTSVTLFYPGQSSYEWVRSKEHKRANAKVESGEACESCHKGEEADLGKVLVAGERLDPTPVKGKQATIDLGVQVAYDAKNAYFRLQWKTLNSYPGDEYPYYRFDGTAWKSIGGPKLDRPVQEGKMPGIYEDRATLMIDDGKVPMFAQQGCWLTCHEGERDMPNEFTKDQIASNKLFQAIKRADVRKYLPASRTDPADWKSGKTVEEIEKIKAAGGFVDLIQWRAHRSNPVGMADDGYVLEWRNFDAGKNMFSSNMDPNTKQPRLMWDAKKVGYKAANIDQLHKAPHFLLKGVNTVPFDPNAGWKEGDMLPNYVLSAEDAAGSAADNKATGSWKDGKWTVVITRPLGLTNPDDKTLKEGGVYSVGFAVHDDNITTRGHHVSFVKSIGFGAKADIQATKLQ